MRHAVLNPHRFTPRQAGTCTLALSNRCLAAKRQCTVCYCFLLVLFFVIVLCVCGGGGSCFVLFWGCFLFVCLLFFDFFFNRLVGLVVQAITSRATDLGSISCFCSGSFSRSSNSSDFKTDNSVTALPGAWRDRVSTWTGWRDVTP